LKEVVTPLEREKKPIPINNTGLVCLEKEKKQQFISLNFRKKQ
jgi:hypothetical protein